MPDDLQVALDANPVAAQAFSALSRVNRYAILYRIGAVKRAETRARKIGGVLPGVDVEVRHGGQPYYRYLISAE